MKTIVASGARLDRLPICAFHWRLLGLIGAGMFLDGFEVYLAGGVIGLLIKTGRTGLISGARFISAGGFCPAARALLSWRLRRPLPPRLPHSTLPPASWPRPLPH